MLTKNDFIRIPYAPDLTEGGIAYACRSLPHTYNRMGGSNIKRMQRIVGGVGVELAFRRYLNEREIPFDVKGATPFTEPDKYDVALGGRRCDVKSFLLSRREQITELKRDLNLLLGASALIPSDQFAANTHEESDLYIFAFLTGLVAASRADMIRALGAGNPLYLMHTLPKDWAKPAAWHSLGKLVLKSESDEPVQIELGGQDKDREFVSERILLEPNKRTETEATFHTLAYAHVEKMPDARIGIHSPEKGETYVISASQWGNIQVYGMSVLLVGYLTREEFRAKAQEVPVGSRVYQYSKTQTKNLGVPVRELKPLRPLFEKVKLYGM
jgi:hypothetical protein